MSSLSLLRAQSAPTGTESLHTHTPSVDLAPLVLDQFVTSATPFLRNQVDLAQSTTVLGGRSLLLKKQPSLGETLAGEIGMHATAFGTGASRPIIRGLGGDRIRLLENSVGTLDASVASPDHAVGVEPFLVERIEIVRGPASLLYGSNAVGGVVNTITHRIETDLPTEPVRGVFEARAGGAGDEKAAGGAIDAAWLLRPERALVLHVDLFSRRVGDVRIPGFAESAVVRSEETEHAAEEGVPPPVFAQGRLPNSALDTRAGAAGLSFVTPTFHFGFSHNGLDSNYGVPGHPHHDDAEAGEGEGAGVRIDLRQRRTDVQGEWHGETGVLTGVRFKFGHTRYRHAELEPDGAIGTVYRNHGYDGRLELLHLLGRTGRGALGAQVTRSDLSAVGEEAFLPPSRTRQRAVFAFEEIPAGPRTWQAGARYEHTNLSAVDRGARREGALSASAGVVHVFNPHYSLAASVSHTGRVPNAQELFAFGPHPGTASFEKGDPTMKAERSLASEVSLRRRGERVSASVTAYLNAFNRFIFDAPTGQRAIQEHGEWVFVPVDEDDDGLPVYEARQRDARFWGIEVDSVWHLHHAGPSHLDLRIGGDFTRARSDGRNLPRIPAARVLTGLEWVRGRWSASLDVQWVLRQSRVADYETPSDGYTLVGASLSRSFALRVGEMEVFLRGTNLANEEARPHPSRVRHLAPLPGRAVLAGARWRF